MKEIGHYKNAENQQKLTNWSILKCHNYGWLWLVVSNYAVIVFVAGCA